MASGWEALRRESGTAAGMREPGTRREEDEGTGGILACAVCLRPVTTRADRMEMAGGHEHTFENPHGIRFHIGCFSRAPGCVAVGEPSTFWTWFPPYAWQVETCGTCGEHLGWLFRSGEGRFHGLILDRLVEIEDGA